MAACGFSGGSNMEKVQKQVFFFFGEDEFAVKEEAKTLIQKLVPSYSEDGSLELLDGATVPLEEMLNALQTLPLFTPKKIIWIHNLKCLEKSSAPGADEFLAVVRSSLANENVLVLTHAQIDQRLKVVTELKKLSHWEEVHSGETWLTAAARDILREAQKTMENKALEHLRELTSEHPEAFVQELKKIITYAGPKKSILKMEDVLAVASSYGGKPFFQFVDHIFSRKPDLAIQTLRQLLLQGENPIGLVHHLLNSLRLLIELRSLVDAGLIQEKKIPITYRKEQVYSLMQALPQEIVSSFPSQANPVKQHPYRIHVLLNQSRHFTLQELHSLFLKAVKAYWELVNSHPADVSLEKIAFELNITQSA